MPAPWTHFRLFCGGVSSGHVPSGFSFWTTGVLCFLLSFGGILPHPAEQEYIKSCEYVLFQVRGSTHTVQNFTVHPLSITVCYLWNTATFPVQKKRTSFLSLQTLSKDILSEFAAHVACFWGMWIPTISKHQQTDAWHFKVEDLPLRFDVRLPDLLQASMLHATLFRRRDHVTFHDIHSTLKQFDLRKARRRSIMHSATHAGRFLRLAEAQVSIGIGSTHTDDWW